MDASRKETEPASGSGASLPEVVHALHDPYELSTSLRPSWPAFAMLSSGGNSGFPVGTRGITLAGLKTGRTRLRLISFRRLRRGLHRSAGWYSRLID
ncbi:MAG: hypothetical protein CMJ59_11315 [Planctomycetaceae bacterium]|nr:hypothetical protein [Planctomycetaceae bacterium]